MSTTINDHVKKKDSVYMNDLLKAFIENWMLYNIQAVDN